MHLTPNLNGTNRATLVTQREKIHRAATALLDAMTEGWPNGRDYQLKPENMKADLEEWNAFATTVRSFRTKMEREAEKIAFPEET